MYEVGDLVRFIEDPYSFMMEKKSLINETGIIVSIDDTTKVYDILVTGSSRVVKVMNHVLEKVAK